MGGYVLEHLIEHLHGRVGRDVNERIAEKRFAGEIKIQARRHSRQRFAQIHAVNRADVAGDFPNAVMLQNIGDRAAFRGQRRKLDLGTRNAGAAEFAFGARLAADPTLRAIGQTAAAPPTGETAYPFFSNSF